MPAVGSIPGLRWLGHAAVLLEGPPAVYLDPWRLEDRDRLPPAGIVLVTHAHFDHASPESVARVAGASTLIAGPADALALLPGARKRAVAAGDSFEEGAVGVRVLPAGDGAPGGFHPPGTVVSFLVAGAGPSLLHCGDGSAVPPPLDPPPEVIGIGVSGGTVPGAEAAAAAAAASGARYALPLHWGDLQGGYADAARFRDALERLAPAARTILREIPGARR